MTTFNSRNKSKIISLSKKLNTKISKIGFIKKEKKIVFRYNMNKLILNTKKMEYIQFLIKILVAFYVFFWQFAFF